MAHHCTTWHITARGHEAHIPQICQLWNVLFFQFFICYVLDEESVKNHIKNVRYTELNILTEKMLRLIKYITYLKRLNPNLETPYHPAPKAL